MLLNEAVSRASMTLRILCHMQTVSAGADEGTCAKAVVAGGEVA